MSRGRTRITGVSLQSVGSSYIIDASQFTIHAPIHSPTHPATLSLSPHSRLRFSRVQVTCRTCLRHPINCSNFHLGGVQCYRECHQSDTSLRVYLAVLPRSHKTRYTLRKSCKLNEMAAWSNQRLWAVRGTPHSCV